MAHYNEIDELRRQAAKLRVMLMAARDARAKKASEINTGTLATIDGKFEHESILREMILFDQDAQIVEAIEKALY